MSIEPGDSRRPLSRGSGSLRLARDPAWSTWVGNLALRAIEELFHHGERWRHHRRTAEQLKAEGWRSFQCTGPYQRFCNHGAAYSEFAGAVERLLEADVKTYINEIAREQKQDARRPVAGHRGAAGSST